MGDAIKDWLFARYLSRRCKRRKTTICRRRSDDTLWAASSPQNFAYAMRGMFGKRGPDFHFAAVAIWRGVPIVVPKLFWSFSGHGKFDIMEKNATGFWLEPWPERVECEKIDATIAQTH